MLLQSNSSAFEKVTSSHHTDIKDTPDKMEEEPIRVQSPDSRDPGSPNPEPPKPVSSSGAKLAFSVDAIMAKGRTSPREAVNLSTGPAVYPGYRIFNPAAGPIRDYPHHHPLPVSPSPESGDEDVEDADDVKDDERSRSPVMTSPPQPTPVSGHHPFLAAAAAAAAAAGELGGAPRWMTAAGLPPMHWPSPVASPPSESHLINLLISQGYHLEFCI